MPKDTSIYKLKYLIVPDFIYSDKTLNGTELRVVSFIYSYTGEKFFFSNKKLSQMFNVTPQTITNTISSLEKKGYIKTDYEIKSGGGQVRFISRLKDLLYSDHKGSYSPTIKPLIGKGNKVKVNKEKDNNIRQECEEILTYWNEKRGTRYKSVASFESNWEHWRNTYELAEIKKAVDNINGDNFWKDKMTPAIFFRRRNPRGENVDYIGDFLNVKGNGNKKFEAEGDLDEKYAKFT